MKLKEVIFTSILISFLIIQNYILYSFPITLTYLILYLISNKISNKTLINMSVFLFVLVKNIVTTALPTTIVFDIIGLLLFVNVVCFKNKKIVYVLIPFLIIFHILLLDLSYAILTDNIFLGMVSSISTGFITYIYAPLSIVLIIIVDGIDYITDLEI